MIERFEKYLNEKNLWSDKILLAVSGGVDSMVLLWLSRYCKLNIEVAHVNYRLRGEDSESDMNFVAEYCEKYQITFHGIDGSHIINMPGNFQGNAREFRYEKFTELCKLRKLDIILTGQHRNDVLEGFMMKVVRGVGLLGLNPQNEQVGISRPFRSIFKNEILAFAKEYKIVYREDKSNKTLKYTRNYVRHEVLPLLDKMHPGDSKGLLRTISNLEEDSFLLSSLLNTLEKSCTHVQFGLQYLDLEKINTWNIDGLLKALLRNWGFTSTQFNNFKDSRNHSEFHSRLGSFQKKGKYLIIKPNSYSRIAEKVLEFDKPYAYSDVEFITVTKTKRLDKDVDLMLNQKHVIGSISLSPYNGGDYIRPMGMQGKSKSLNKFLKERGLSKMEREACVVLKDSEKILAIPGYGIDESQKIMNGDENNTIFVYLN